MKLIKNGFVNYWVYVLSFGNCFWERAPKSVSIGKVLHYSSADLRFKVDGANTFERKNFSPFS